MLDLAHPDLHEVSVVDEHVGDGDEHGHVNRPEQAARASVPTRSMS